MKENRPIKWISALCLAAAVLLSLPGTALATGTFGYEGQTEGIVFSRDGAVVTELFSGFENIVPGDSLTETVELQNNSPEQKTVKIYLRAYGPESGEDFLAQLRLTVSSGSRQLSQGTADRSEALSDWVLLGTLPAGERQTLTLRLEAPITLGNEFQEAAGTLRWGLKVEEVDSTSPTPSPTGSPRPEASPKPGKPGNVPKTGDEAKLGLYAVLAVSSASVLFLLLLGGVRRRRNEAKRHL